MPNRCVVPGCDTGKKRCKKTYSLFKVSDEEMRRKWEAAIPGLVKQLKPNQAVCERHFEERCLVRKWFKYDLEGAVVAEWSYKRVNLLDGAVPSKFNCAGSKKSSVLKGKVSSKANSGTVRDPLENEDVARQKKETSLTTRNNLVYQAEEDEDSSTKQFDDSEVDLFQPESVFVEELPKLKPFTTTAPLGLKFLGAMIKFSADSTTPDEGTTVPLPPLWNATLSSSGNEQKIIITYVAVSKDDTPVIKKSLTIDRDKELTYHVHGILLKDKRELPQVLTTTESLSSILIEFESLRVCAGLGDIYIELALVHPVLKDSFNIWRARNCTLIGRNEICDICAQLGTRVVKRNS